jgi:hypothetical protein
MGILIFKRLTAQRLYKSFGVKGLRWLVSYSKEVVNVRHLKIPLINVGGIHSEIKST